jgi:hypothetical protein
MFTIRPPAYRRRDRDHGRRSEGSPKTARTSILPPPGARPDALADGPCHRRDGHRRWWRRGLLVVVAPILAGLSMAVLGVGTAAAEAPAASASLGHTLQITARDDAFTVNTTHLAAGLLTTTMHNRGRSPHQAQVGRFRPGANITRFAAAVKAHHINQALALIDSYAGGPNVVVPGSKQTTYQNLRPGKYVLLCFVADDKAPHLPHFAMGMFTALDVSGPTRSATPAHVARAVFAVDDRRFVIPAALKTGTTVQFTNNSTKDVHEFSVGRLLPGKTTKDLVRWAKTEQGPPPYVPLGGAGAVSPHGRDWFLLNLPPGRYVALCLVPDDEPPHLAHAATGMVHTFTVTR